MNQVTDKDIVNKVMTMLADSGSHSYGGEDVSQLEHALQAAMLAEETNKDEEFVVACLLHDLGHLTADAQEVFNDDTASQEQLRHEGAGHGHAGAEFLADVITERMGWLIEHHATAKRYLCAVEPGYYDQLSPVSKQTLEYQGGPMTAEEVNAIKDHPWLEDLLLLRRFDDEAKRPGHPTPDLDHYRPMLERHIVS